MKMNMIILAAFLLAGGLWTGFANNWERSNVPSMTLDPAPTFNYTRLDGNAGALADHKGKVVMVHFWASWCAPCVVEFPSLIALAEERRKDLVILAISTDDNKDDIDKFLTKIDIKPPKNFIIAQDAEKAIAEGLYGTMKLPETFLLTPGLAVFEKVTGPEDQWNNREWHRKIDLLAVHNSVGN